MLNGVYNYLSKTVRFYPRLGMNQRKKNKDRLIDSERYRESERERDRHTDRQTVREKEEKRQRQ